MAVEKLSTSVSLVLEVQNGVDSDGDPKYTKRSFSGLNSDVASADALAVGTAISKVLENKCSGCYISETSLLVNNEE